MIPHSSITAQRVYEAVVEGMCSTDSPGFCLSCGADADGVEPDARGYTCDVCGDDAVASAQFVLLTVSYVR